MAKTIVLGVTGSIAAYKAADIVSRLKKKGYEVRVILTKSGAHFITPLTLETLSKSAVYVDQFSRETPYDVTHISLAKDADVFLVAPASANFIAKAANGIADDLITTTYLATRAPVIIAPAMNDKMLTHEATMNNIAILEKRGAKFIETEEGLLACNDVGKGRLAQVDDIIKAVEDVINPKRDLEGKNIIVSAGPTIEDIDPVRYLTNRSSGKMGFAIAAAAARRGANVTLIAGPVTLSTPQGVERVDIRSTKNMFEAINDRFDNAHALIMAAAPADFTPETVNENKIKKTGGELELTLQKTPDILASMGKNKKNQVLVGFAAETNDVENYAKGKLERKNLDFIAANDVSAKGVGFACDTNAVTLYSKSGKHENSGLLSKEALADWLLDRVF